MNRTTQRGILIGLAITLFFGLGMTAIEGGSTSGAVQQGVDVQAKPLDDAPRGRGIDHRNMRILTTRESAAPRPFKLNAAGGIDLTTGAVVFGGVGSHLGLYQANGFLDPATFSIFGTIEAANGDTLNFTAAFAVGPTGELSATFFVAGGTGRFVDAVGLASGPVTLDSDLTFLISVKGNLNY